MTIDKSKLDKAKPSFHNFVPLPWQRKLIYDIKKVYDYSIGPHYVLLSGCIGSAKSLVAAFLIVEHAIRNANTTIVIGRLSLPQLKQTLFVEVLDMLGGTFKEGRDFWVNRTTAHIKLANGTQIVGITWIDKRFKSKFRSLQTSMIVFEEAIENSGDYWQVVDEAAARLGRVLHVKNNLFLFLTNPDEPSHPIYDFFQNKCLIRKPKYWTSERGDRHIYYSSIKDNPYLPEFYEDSLRDKFDEQMAERMLDGKWIYIGKGKCYYSYQPDQHITNDLELDLKLDLRLCFDFNIAKNKPMSSCIMQFDRRPNDAVPNNRRFKILDEVCVEGMRTIDTMEAWANKGWLDQPHNPKIIVHGDASGNHRQTAALRTDYEIIEHFLTNYQRKDKLKIKAMIDVQRKNPSIRERHNIVNCNLKTAKGVIRVAIHNRCKNVQEGLASTKLKDIESYIEDQTTKGQDMAAALSYGIWYCDKYEGINFDPVSMEGI